MPTKPEKDEISGTETTGHEWDGIKELDNPLPRWWLYIMAGTFVFALIYWVLYPAWPSVKDFSKGLLGYSSRANLTEEVEAAHARQASYIERIEAVPAEEVQADPELFAFAMAGGRSAFAVNCSQCHGTGAEGAVGYPNLNDDDWLWGGTIEAIETTIRYGIRSEHEDTRLNEMPAFLADEWLTEEQINDVAEYVLSLTDQATDQAAAERGKAVFEECSACHGEQGEGIQELGAPALNDHIWLYGGEKEDIVQTVSYSRGGVMPAWEGRLDDATIKQLAVYIHGLGGGQ